MLFSWSWCWGLWNDESAVMKARKPYSCASCTIVASGPTEWKERWKEKTWSRQTRSHRGWRILWQTRRGDRERVCVVNPSIHSFPSCCRGDHCQVPRSSEMESLSLWRLTHSSPFSTHLCFDSSHCGWNARWRTTESMLHPHLLAFSFFLLAVDALSVRSPDTETGLIDRTYPQCNHCSVFEWLCRCE